MKQVRLRVIVPVSDMWKRPAFESGRTNQVVFGQVLRVAAAGSKGDYSEVKTEDGYRGWIRGDHCEEVGPQRGEGRRTAVQVPVAEVHQLPSPLAPAITRLSYGSEVQVDQVESGWAWLPQLQGWVRREHLRRSRRSGAHAGRILRTLKTFLGTPYLWGGRSGFGIDCSGLVQLVFNFHGLRLPRDTKDQIHCGRRVTRQRLAAGDLIFSPGHVSVYIDGGRILHSSLKAGGVAIQALDPESPMYRPDIAERILVIRRVL